jgi:hypothetical protein
MAGLNATPATGTQAKHVIVAAMVKDGLLQAIFKATFKVSFPPSAPITRAALSAAISAAVAEGDLSNKPIETLTRLIPTLLK